jgi:hypothetical protein
MILIIFLRRAEGLGVFENDSFSYLPAGNVRGFFIGALCGPDQSPGGKIYQGVAALHGWVPP